MLYMIFVISFSIFSFFLLLFFTFHFFKTIIFGYFWSLAKNTPKLQELFKKLSKSSICPIIFHISLTKIHFLMLTFFLGPLTWNRPLGTDNLKYDKNISAQKLTKHNPHKGYVARPDGKWNIMGISIFFRKYNFQERLFLCTLIEVKVQTYVMSHFLSAVTQKGPKMNS